MDWSDSAEAISTVTGTGTYGSRVMNSDTSSGVQRHSSRSRAKSNGATTPMPCCASSSGPTTSVGSNVICEPTALGLGTGVDETLADAAGSPDVVARLRHPVEPVDDRRVHVAGHPADVAVQQQVVAAVEDGEVDDAGQHVDVLLLLELPVEHPAGEGEVDDVARD